MPSHELGIVFLSSAIFQAQLNSLIQKSLSRARHNTYKHLGLSLQKFTQLH